MIAYMNYEGVILVVGFPPQKKKFFFIYSSQADTPKREMEAVLPVLGKHSTMNVGHLLMPPVWMFEVSSECFSLYSLQFS